MVDQRKRRAAALGVVAVILVVSGGLAFRILNVQPDGFEVLSAPTPAAQPSLALQCESGMVNSGILDFVGPGSAADGRAQDWPTSPEEAARSTLTAPILAAARLEGLNLRDGVPVDLPGRAEGFQFPATARDGSTTATITVEETVQGFWSTTHIETCG